MQCPTCVDTTVTAFCRNCGKGVCRQCAQDYDNVPHCAECAAELQGEDPEGMKIQVAFESSDPPPVKEAPAPPPPPRPRVRATENPDAPHPGIAGVLGLVPGLGAVYNGQYVKGVLHALLFGLGIAIASSTPIGPAFAPVIVVFFLYMPIEAYRTAQAMRRGETVDEMSGLVGAIFQPRSGSPVGGLLIIALGVLLLLFTLGVFRLEQVAPFWPIVIIVFGIWRLYRAIQAASDPTPPFSSGSKDSGDLP